MFASESTAAKLLDMKPREFRELVEAGHLPRPREIGGLKRWDVPELRRILSGEAADGMGDVQW
jgi:predicted DNA-binding transcriptional regulator AlpA